MQAFAETFPEAMIRFTNDMVAESEGDHAFDVLDSSHFLARIYDVRNDR